MAEVFLSPTSAAKLKTKESIHKLKHGSPKLQEALRQRCREKMREKRGQLFNKRRLNQDSPQDVYNTLSKIVRREFQYLAAKELQYNVNSEEKLLDFPLSLDEALELECELISEEEQWLFQEYERILSEEEELQRIIQEKDKHDVLCPMCQRSQLNESLNFIVCNKCDLKLPARISLNNLSIVIETAVNRHSLNCIQVPSFMTLPENDTSLCMTCSACSEFTILI